MLLKPDKLPSLTTSYRPISLISSIMNLFEGVIEQRLRSHLEQIERLQNENEDKTKTQMMQSFNQYSENETKIWRQNILNQFNRVSSSCFPSHFVISLIFINKHQSGFIRTKSTDYHLFRLSQSIMESFNRGEHVVATFLDVEKAFDNVWHNGLRYKIFQLDLQTKMTRWLSHFLVGRVIQVSINGFLSNQINPKVEVPQGRGSTGFCPESITFSDLRQRHSNTTPQTKLTIPVR